MQYLKFKNQYVGMFHLIFRLKIIILYIWFDNEVCMKVFLDYVFYLQHQWVLGTFHWTCLDHHQWMLLPESCTQCKDLYEHKNIPPVFHFFKTFVASIIIPQYGKIMYLLAINNHKIH